MLAAGVGRVSTESTSERVGCDTTAMMRHGDDASGTKGDGVGLDDSRRRTEDGLEGREVQK